MADSVVNVIDLHTVMAILDKAEREVGFLDGTEYDDDTANSTERAAISRRLNRLADDLVLASALVRNEYWEGRA